MPSVRAFYFNGGVSAQSACSDLPTGGIFVQSPSGQKVEMKVNGADLTIGSSVIFRKTANGTILDWCA